ncbi:MAG: hypothetical protein ACI9JZ_002950 [Lentimonas sp.]|jgi:hypothetical protein
MLIRLADQLSEQNQITQSLAITPRTVMLNAPLNRRTPTYPRFRPVNFDNQQDFSPLRVSALLAKLRNPCPDQTG